MILRLLVHAGEKCAALMGRLIVNVPVKQVQCDEIWGYVGKKEKNKSIEEANNDGLGDAYCFVAIERHTKLILNFALGRRTQETTNVFIEGLRYATAKQSFQLTTDGFLPYVGAIDATLSDRVDYAQIVKQYAESGDPEKRYSPAVCIGCKKRAIIGDPDPAMISTSHIERSNLTMRTQIKRLARLTLSFSKKWEKPLVRDCAPLCLLQLLPDSFQFARYARDGIKPRGSRLDDCRTSGVIRYAHEIGRTLGVYVLDAQRQRATAKRIL